MSWMRAPGRARRFGLPGGLAAMLDAIHFQPAFRHRTSKAITVTPGYHDPELLVDGDQYDLSDEDMPWLDDYEDGFVDAEGKWYTRLQAAAAVKDKYPEAFDRRGLTAEDLPMIQPLRRTGVGGLGSDDADRSARSEPMTEDHRLPNVHRIIPAYIMRRIPYHGEATVTVYRSVPKGVTEIRPGDWVALTRAYAEMHARGRTLSKRVPAMHVAWAGTDENEWFYSPG